MAYSARPQNERLSLPTLTSHRAFYRRFRLHRVPFIIELDGNPHDNHLERDENRDFVFSEWGWRTLRFLHVYARDNPDGLWREIETEIEARL